MNRTGARFLAPFSVGVLALTVVPALLTLRYAFTRYTGFSPPVPNGLDNLTRLLNDPQVLDSLRASALHVVITVPLRLLAAVGLGLFLAAPRRGGSLYRAAVFLPTVVPDVAMALLFLWVLNPLYGPVNQLLGAVGLPEPNWLATPWGARSGIAMMALLAIGEAFVVVLAARRAIHPVLYDLAASDGASPWQQLRHVTLPLLAPILLVLAVRDLAASLQNTFVPAYALTDGGPGTATLFYPIYVFDQSFEFASFGYGAFLTLALLVVTIGLIALLLLTLRRTLSRYAEH